jgi:hypothetical protein
MEILPLSFVGKGNRHCDWDFIQVKRDGNVAMYERKDRMSGRSHWEVILVKQDKGGKRVIGGVEVFFKPKEVYPSDNDFGDDGWCYGDREAAESKFCLLVSKVKVDVDVRDIVI